MATAFGNHDLILQGPIRFILLPQIKKRFRVAVNLNKKLNNVTTLLFVLCFDTIRRDYVVTCETKSVYYSLCTCVKNPRAQCCAQRNETTQRLLINWQQWSCRVLKAQKPTAGSCTTSAQCTCPNNLNREADEPFLFI